MDGPEVVLRANPLPFLTVGVAAPDDVVAGCRPVAVFVVAPDVGTYYCTLDSNTARKPE